MRNPVITFTTLALALASCADKGPPCPSAATWSLDGDLMLGGKGTHFDPSPPLEGDYSPPGDIWVARVDPAGPEFKWQLEVDAGEAPEDVNEIVQVDADTFVVLARSGEAYSSYRTDLLRIDGTGRIQWHVGILADPPFYPVDMASTPGGEVLVLGSRDLNASVIRIDRLGNVVWSIWKDRPGQVDDDLLTPVSLHVVDDDSFAVVSAFRDIVPGCTEAAIDMVLGRFSMDGSPLFQRRLDMQRIQWIESTVSHPDGTMVLAGHSQTEEGLAEHWYVALDASGEVLWQQLLETGDGQYVWGLASRPGGGTAVMTSYRDAYMEVSQLAAVFLDADGAILGARRYDPPSPAGIVGIRGTGDGVHLVGWQQAGTIQGWSVPEGGEGPSCGPVFEPMEVQVLPWSVALTDTDLTWAYQDLQTHPVSGRVHRRSGGQTFDFCF